MTAFFVLCSDGGRVARSSNSDCAVGSTLAGAFARDSRGKVMQLLVDARGSVASALLQTRTGEPVEVLCANDGTSALFVAGTTLADVRACAEELSKEGDAAELAQRIVLDAQASPLSVDLWEELARVNNELSTTHRQLAKTNAELRWLNEQKNQLLGMAAHDLRNPLAAVLAYTTFLLEDRDMLSPDHIELIGMIREGADSMLAIVEDVVDFSAIESGTVRLDTSEFAIGELIRDVVDVCRIVATRKDIDLVTAIDAETPPLVADRRKITQVLYNLVTNAIKFSHPGSFVSVAAGNADDGGVWVSVTDRGVGMSSAQAARLFQPFGRVGTTPTAGEKSTGLGLAIVSRIVTAHDGRIDVESAPGEGSTFTITFQPARRDVAATR